MTGIEWRYGPPQNKEAAFDDNAPGGFSHWKRQNADEMHVGSAEVHTHSYSDVLRDNLELSVSVQLKNGKPIEVTHLYVERDESQYKPPEKLVGADPFLVEAKRREAATQVHWWIEQEPVTAWKERVREAHEEGIIPDYKYISEHRVPSVVTHTYPKGGYFINGEGGYYNEYGFHWEYNVGHMVAHYPTPQEQPKEAQGKQIYSSGQVSDERVATYIFEVSALVLCQAKTDK